MVPSPIRAPDDMAPVPGTRSLGWIAALLTVLLVALWPLPAFACVCELPSPTEADQYAAVFLGRIVAQPDAGSLVMDRLIAWRGGSGRITLVTPYNTGSCYEAYQPGEWHLVYAYSEEGRVDLQTGYCQMIPAVWAWQDMLALTGRGRLLLLLGSAALLLAVLVWGATRRREGVR